jgi:putative ABC transport system permease protein
LASVAGSLVGLSIGFKLFPTVIFNAYRILYAMPDLIAPFRLDYAVYCTLASVLVTTSASYAACRKELRLSPAALMRPKAPKAGKRILLEKISFIWNRLGFLRKVTLRNMFRYKKRLFMTIIGIAGCTALILAGFGLQNSITSIVDKQYKEIYVFDLMGFYDDSIDSAQIAHLKTSLDKSGDILSDYMFSEQKAIDASYGGAKKNVYLMVFDRPGDVSKYINLKNRSTQESISLEREGCVITEKLSKLLNIKIGDDITVTFADNSSFAMPVTGICENYTLNYVYMSKDAYVNASGEQPVYNSFLGRMNNADTSDELSKELLENKNILYIAYTKDSGNNFKDVVSNLNYIVLVIIVSAGLLAFIVLYNLISINVNERVRELATIKVLGFFDREVSAYIYKENTLSSLIGIVLGLFMGIPLEKFVISSAEIDAVMFAPGINFMSFVYAGLLTLLFNLMVNFFVHFRLKKIDMVESLKSVE